MDAAAAAELRRLTGLRELKYVCRGLFPSCIVAALPSLEQLRNLTLSGDNLLRSWLKRCCTCRS